MVSDIPAGDGKTANLFLQCICAKNKAQADLKVLQKIKSPNGSCSVSIEQFTMLQNVTQVLALSGLYLNKVCQNHFQMFKMSLYLDFSCEGGGQKWRKRVGEVAFLLCFIEPQICFQNESTAMVS